MSEVSHAIPAVARHLLTGPAERGRVLELLRRMESTLRGQGVRRLRLFGSVARGEADLASDVDLIAEIDRTRAPSFSLIDLIGLEQNLAEQIGRPVQIATAPEKMRSYVRDNVEREAAEIF